MTTEQKSSAIGVYRALRPLLFALPPETAHHLALRVLGSGLWRRAAPMDDARLAIRVLGRRFANPVGLAAGFDKDGLAWQGALRLGFGFVEVGSVTPKPQTGNPRPRLFRSLKDGAIINRMGFNNAGLAAMRDRLSARSRECSILGVNLGKNKDTQASESDYASGAAGLGPLADYIVVNVSSPNTPGLRALQNSRTLSGLSESVRSALRGSGADVPLILKISPDLGREDLADIAGVAVSGAFDAIIVGNTTVSRPDGLDPSFAREQGGLSGRPLFSLSTRVLSDMYRLTRGAVPLIGVGGISDADDAYAKIRAGASLVQLYSALVYRGPGIVAVIKRGLLGRMEGDGFASIAEAVGADHRR